MESLVLPNTAAQAKAFMTSLPETQQPTAAATTTTNSLNNNNNNINTNNGSSSNNNNNNVKTEDTKDEVKEANDESASGIVPTLQNIVATVNLDCRLDLKTIALHARNAEYNPKVCIL